MKTKELVLIVDAGHGNLDAQGNYTTDPKNGKKWKLAESGYHGNGWFYEGYSNRQFADDFIKKAIEMGYSCHPVHHPIQDNSLDSRTDAANSIYKNLGYPKCLFISFHSNAFDTNSRGFQAYHHTTSTKGKLAAEIIAKNCVPYCALFESRSVNPVRPANFYVLTYTQMPAILLEILFFDNIPDADLLMDMNFRSGLIDSVLSGIEEINSKI